MPQSVTKVRKYKSYNNRAYRVGTQRYRDTIEKVYQFINRSIESLQKALMALRTRYKTVKIQKKLVGCLWEGYIVVTI